MSKSKSQATGVDKGGERLLHPDPWLGVAGVLTAAGAPAPLVMVAVAAAVAVPLAYALWRAVRSRRG